MPHHVVILGGSYGGIAAMRRLSKYPEIQVTLIDQHPYHFLQTEGYELISSNTSFEETIVSLPALCANYENVTFRHRTVVSITPPKKVILLNDGELPYDTLIIALGSVIIDLMPSPVQAYIYTSSPAERPYLTVCIPPL